MRLWSLHPRYLDAKGLVAAWREALLAKKVLSGQTQGYKQHPQLIRFKNNPNPLAAINYFLRVIALEASERGYRFDHTKLELVDHPTLDLIPVTQGQVNYEFQWLKYKLGLRNKQKFEQITRVRDIKLNPLFYLVEGGVEVWEKIKKVCG